MMRYVNEKYETIDPGTVNLEKGYLCGASIIKADAVPPDDITKFAYDDGDYEPVIVYMRIPEQELLRRQIDEKKQKLSETDYVVIKIAEGAATFKEYAETIAERQELREEINVLEQALIS